MKEEYTTDIDFFLDALDTSIETEDDKTNLEEAVLTRGAVGGFRCWSYKGQTVVAGPPAGLTLRIINDKAQALFISRLRAVHVEDEEDQDYRRAVDEPKS